MTTDNNNRKVGRRLRACVVFPLDDDVELLLRRIISIPKKKKIFTFSTPSTFPSIRITAFAAARPGIHRYNTTRPRSHIMRVTARTRVHTTYRCVCVCVHDKSSGGRRWQPTYYNNTRAALTGWQRRRRRRRRRLEKKTAN